MIVTPPPQPSPWRLRWDLFWGRLLLGLTQAEHRGELWPRIHRFMADRYDQLAEDARTRGRTNTDRLAEAARRHAELAGDDDDLPPACAMGLPRPRPRIPVDVRGRVVTGPWPRSRPPRSLSPSR